MSFLSSSVPGVGSTFWFTARLRKVAGRTNQGRNAPGSAEPAVALGHAHARLLMVDDDAVNREVAMAMLQTVLTHVDVAASGREAVRMAG